MLEKTNKQLTSQTTHYVDDFFEIELTPETDPPDSLILALHISHGTMFSDDCFCAAVACNQF